MSKTSDKTYSVVYNACYGGFGLSKEAAKYLASKGDAGATAYLSCEENFRADGAARYQFSPRWKRHDARLVDVVTTLGASASGECAELRLYVLSGRAYRITEHDGYERVEDICDVEVAE